MTYGNFGGAQDFNFGSLSYFPTPGKIYRVDVSTDLYGSISSEYFQPLPVEVDMVVLKTLGKNPSIGENVNDVQYKVTFTDPPEENFYQIIIKRQSDDSSFPQSSQQNNISFVDPAYKEANEIFGQYSTMCFTDSFFNDKKTSLDFKSFISEYPDRPLDYCSIYLNNISKEYYYYLKTFYLQDANLDDPFAQPVQVVNNIHNGFGIFAGYTQTVKIFKVTDW